MVVVHVAAVKVYIAAMQALRKKERGTKTDETQFGTKSDAYLTLTPPLKANVLFCRSFWYQTQGSGALFY